MLGAAMGGVMADYLGWRWEFGVQIPILVFALFVAFITIPDDLGLHGKSKRSVREAMKDFDFKGSFLMATSVTFLILGFVGIFFIVISPSFTRPQSLSLLPLTVDLPHLRTWEGT